MLNKTISNLRPEGAKRALRIGFLIHDVSRLRRTISNQRMRPLRITRSQWTIFVEVSRHNGGGVTQTGIAEALGLAKPAVGGLVDRLEKSGFVSCLPDAQDRRSKKIRLTESGEVLLVSIGDLDDVLNAELMKGVSLEQLCFLGNVLTRMKANLVGMDAGYERVEAQP